MMQLKKGDQILENHKIVDIKEGGQGIVYLVKKLQPTAWETPIICAKTLKIEYLDNEELRKNFVEECQFRKKTDAYFISVFTLWSLLFKPLGFDNAY
jgi:hypothetical protein